MCGMVRKIDDLGRIVYSYGNTIVIEKYKPDRLEEKVREMQNILEQQIDEVGLERALQIEKTLNEIQELL